MSHFTHDKLTPISPCYSQKSEEGVGHGTPRSRRDYCCIRESYALYQLDTYSKSKTLHGNTNL